MLYFIHIDVKDFDSNFQDLYFLLSFVFVLLSGSRLVLSFPHRCSPLFILCFYLLNFACKLEDLLNAILGILFACHRQMLVFHWWSCLSCQS